MQTRGDSGPLLITPTTVNDSPLHGPGTASCPLLFNLRTNAVPPNRGDQWLRTNIFRSSCTINGNVCSFIIDSGSSCNVVSADAVHQLKLPFEAHPTLYALNWIQNGCSIQITHRVLIPFSVGPVYKERMFFDIVPMDMCHLILGRPWEFDRRILHDGAKNTYRFTWETHQILLLPTPDKSSHSPRSDLRLQSVPPQSQQPVASGLLCSLAKFEEEFRKEGIAFALVTTPTAVKIVSPSHTFDPLLREFDDVFPVELHT